MRYQFIEKQLQQQGSSGPQPSLSAWCRALKVSRSGYHAYFKRLPSTRARESERLVEKIRQIHRDSKQTYGSPRIHLELRQQGEQCGKNRVARLMKQHQISAGVKKQYVLSTDSNHPLPVAENLLGQEFSAPGPDSCWVSDITYLWTSEGWLYLAVVLDLYSRRVVGWSLKPTMQRELVIEALQAALQARRPKEGLLLHSDRGSQYASQDYQRQLRKAGLVCSMSRKGNCYDNAVVESFFATLKRELIHQRRFQTKEEARLRLFEWIEVWYNRKRRHSSLGYLSPVLFEEEQQQRTEQSNLTSRIAA